MTIEDSIALLVRQHVPSAQLLSVEKLTGGVSATVYRLDLTHAGRHNSQLILRLHGSDYSRHDAELEFQLLQSLHSIGLPVPRPIGFEASCQILNKPYVLMDFVAGTTAIPDGKVEESIRTMADALVAVHQTPIDLVPELPKRIDPRPELLDFLSDEPEWDDFRAHLSTLNTTTYTGTPVLLHGDFWPENLIWRDGDIAAILDWEDAAIGDPLSDLACSCLELRYLFGKPGSDRFKQVYRARLDVDPSRLALWQAYVSSAAQRYIGDWGLEPDRESYMRKTALVNLREAAELLICISRH